jgi:hypothetical protein
MESTYTSKPSSIHSHHPQNDIQSLFTSSQSSHFRIMTASSGTAMPLKSTKMQASELWIESHQSASDQIKPIKESDQSLMPAQQGSEDQDRVRGNEEVLEDDGTHTVVYRVVIRPWEDILNIDDEEELASGLDRLPMQRWEQETSRDQPWNVIDSVVDIVDKTEFSNTEAVADADDWSVEAEAGPECCCEETAFRL